MTSRGMICDGGLLIEVFYTSTRGGLSRKKAEERRAPARHERVLLELADQALGDPTAIQV
jgi:hypothetical protein